VDQALVGLEAADNPPFQQGLLMGSPTGAGLATPGPVSQLPTLRQMWLAKLKYGRQMRLVSGAEMPRDYCHLPYCFRDVSDLSG
jgi:hypothetical protein